MTVLQRIYRFRLLVFGLTVSFKGPSPNLSFLDFPVGGIEPTSGSSQPVKDKPSPHVLRNKNCTNLRIMTLRRIMKR